MPHVWRPVRASPVTLMHDMTIRDGGEEGNRAGSCGSGGSGNDTGEGGATLTSGAAHGGTAVGLRAAEDAACAVAGRLAAHRAALVSHWLASGAIKPPSPVLSHAPMHAVSAPTPRAAFPETGAVPPAVLGASSRVAYVAVPRFDVQPWRAGVPCVEDIFDA